MANQAILLILASLLCSCAIATNKLQQQSSGSLLEDYFRLIDADSTKSLSAEDLYQFAVNLYGAHPTQKSVRSFGLLAKSDVLANFLPLLVGEINKNA